MVRSSRELLTLLYLYYYNNSKELVIILIFFIDDCNKSSCDAGQQAIVGCTETEIFSKKPKEVNLMRGGRRFPLCSDQEITNCFRMLVNGQLTALWICCCRIT